MFTIYFSISFHKGNIHDTDLNRELKEEHFNWTCDNKMYTFIMETKQCRNTRIIQ